MVIVWLWLPTLSFLKDLMDASFSDCWDASGRLRFRPCKSPGTELGKSGSDNHCTLMAIGLINLMVETHCCDSKFSLIYSKCFEVFLMTSVLIASR